MTYCKKNEPSYFLKTNTQIPERNSQLRTLHNLIMIQKETTIQRIEALYLKLNNKTKFLRTAEPVLRKRYGTLRNHWFSGGFSIPAEYQKQVLELLEKAIKEQNKQLAK